MKNEPEIKEFFRLKKMERYDEAFDVLVPLKKKYPESAEIHFLLGVALYLADRYEESLPFLKKSTSLKPTNERSSVTLFHALFSLGKIHSALSEMRRYYLTSSKTKEYDLTMAEMLENIDNFSTSERALIKKIYKEFVNKKK